MAILYDSTITDPKDTKYGKKKVSNYFFAIDFKHRDSNKWELDSNLPKKMDRFFDYGITKIVITSGYRTKTANDKANGSKASKHCLGMAADIKCYIKDTPVPCSYLCCLAAHIIGFGGVARIGSDGCATPPAGQSYAKDGYLTHVDIRTDSRYWGNERPKGKSGGTDYSSNVSNFYSYFNLTEASVLGWFNAKKTTAAISVMSEHTNITHNEDYIISGSTDADNINTLDLDSVLQTAVDLTGEYKLVIESFACDCNSTAAVAIAKVTNNFKDYKWSYEITSFDDTSYKNSEELKKVKSSLISFKISNLAPDTTYALELIAKDSSGEEHRSSKLLFKTYKDCPDPVTNIKFIFDKDDKTLSNSKCELSFDSPNRWENLKDKGYRISLLLNGKIVASKDDFIGSSDTNKKFKLSDLAGKETTISHYDILQVGVQSWVKDLKKNTIFDSEYPRCSKPIYLSSYFNKIDKIFLYNEESYKQATIHNINDV